MTATSIHQMLSEAMQQNEGFPWGIGPILADQLADALLASPELAAMLDLSVQGWTLYDAKTRGLYPELGALCESWRASRAEQKPE